MFLKYSKMIPYISLENLSIVKQLTKVSESILTYIIKYYNVKI